MRFSSDRQRRAMFAAINSFSQKNADNSFALNVVGKKGDYKIRSDEYPEVDVDLDSGNIDLEQIKWDLTGVADQDLIGLDKIRYVNFYEEPGVSEYIYIDEDKPFIKMRDKKRGLSANSGPWYRHKSFKHEVGHHVDRDSLLDDIYDDYVFAEVVADENVRQRYPDYRSEADIFLKDNPRLKEYAVMAAEENVGLSDLKALTFKEAEDYANKYSKDPFGFVDSMDGKPMGSFRIHVKLPNGNVGITAWYSSKDSYEHLIKDIRETGGEIIKVETEGEIEL